MGTSVLAFALDGNNRMTYQVSVGDTVFITPSLLGFTAKDGVNLAEGFKVVNTGFTTHDETWTQPWGENKNIRQPLQRNGCPPVRYDKYQINPALPHLR